MPFYFVAQDSHMYYYRETSLTGLNSPPNKINSELIPQWMTINYTPVLQFQNYNQLRIKTRLVSTMGRLNCQSGFTVLVEATIELAAVEPVLKD